MKYYPVCLDIRDKQCLVVGGGSVATRKVESLLAYSGSVSVVAPTVTETLATMAENGRITLARRGYDATDADDVFLIIGATNDARLNRKIKSDADERNILCNIADFPEACNFILPSVIQRGDFQVTISTAGKSPAFAKHMRKQMETQFGQEYGVFLDLMGVIRGKLLGETHAPEAHKPLFQRIITGGLLDMIGKREIAQIDALLTEVLGSGFTLAELGVDLE
ncbi:MAG: bifunctional precorrin-2 dehydrogenase/sirohydrochlorin ferrochelatase [Thermodesulfobacteriota bacterium]|nr:bifunctional precorrin-2 dehydrogenase/sirohydrochlorin ferrochelatase [Thermodesulfobacteriota bacterium]